MKFIMYKNKGLILFILLTVILIIVTITCIKNNNNPNIKSELSISEINEECFDILLNIDDNKAIVDGNTISLTELFAISDDELKEMISNNNFKNFLEENFIGDIEYEENFVTITNSYSTKSLIIETLDQTVLEEYESIDSVEKIAENIYIVEYKNAIDTKNGYKELQKDNSILNVIKDRKVHIFDNNFKIESVSNKNTAWGVNTTGLGHYKTKLNYLEHDTDIKVAVLDTGINSLHEVFNINEIADKINFEFSYDYVNKNNDVSDDNGHGTAVAGVIAESTSDNVKIVPVKVMDSNGDGILTDVLDAIEDVYQYVDIINLSLGISVDELSNREKLTLEKFFKQVYDSGTAVICAAGNDSTNVTYPGASAYTLTASAVDSSNNFASSFSNYGEEVDFALPGVNLKLPNYINNSSYVMMSGTSFSCPFLASAVANVKADYEYTNISDIVNILKENAEDLGDTGKDNYYGYGSINFDSNMFKLPIIVNIESTNTEWALENNIVVKAVSGSNIKSYAITLTEEEPLNWTSLAMKSTDLNIELSTINNGNNYVWLKDENDNISYKSVLIQYVDSTKPVINNFEVISTTSYTINTTLFAQDNESGISKIQWYYKKSSDERYIEINEDVGEDSNIKKTYEFTDLESNSEYNVFAKIIDAVGNDIETEVLTIKTLSKEANIVIENKTNRQAKIILGKEERTDDFTITTEEEKFFISCDSACVVILVDENKDTYTRVEYTSVDNNNNYEFDYEIGDLHFIIALKGDVNLNGTVNAADSMLINRSKLSSSLTAYVQLTNIQKIVADVNKNGEVNLADSMLINRSMLSETSDAYLKLEW